MDLLVTSQESIQEDGGFELLAHNFGVSMALQVSCPNFSNLCADHCYSCCSFGRHSVQWLYYCSAAHAHFVCWSSLLKCLGSLVEEVLWFGCPWKYGLKWDDLADPNQRIDIENLGSGSPYASHSQNLKMKHGCYVLWYSKHASMLQNLACG